MKHLTTKRFWKCYYAQSLNYQHLADKSFALLKENPNHPSLHFKKVGKFYSARIDLSIRALAFKDDGNFVWLWIGRHDEYEKIVNSK